MILPLVSTFLLTFCTGQQHLVLGIYLYLPLPSFFFFCFFFSTRCFPVVDNSSSLVPHFYVPGALAEGLQMRVYKGVDNQVT